MTEKATEFDFSTSRPNPYVDKVKKPVTIRLDSDIIEFFKDEAERTGVPYQTLMNLYLGECADRKKRLSFV